MTSRSKASALNLILCASVLLATICSCMGDMRHAAFNNLGNEGWARTDTLTYTIEPINDVEEVGMFLQLCTEGYDYGNIAVNITIKQDSALLFCESRNYRLEQSLPKRGIGYRNDYTMPVGNITLCDTLPTTITITQQFDQPLLTGIRSIGILMKAPMRQPGEPVWHFDW